ncbi:CBASS cGAMP-activated phospholipase [Variovorax sp. DT-64]|uniref:CBASS cGAMP-activated phospholipase n=1 Tax=Variovorax sp. DT-64 TaxID=3396160 RepID=UPI003F19F3D8
MNTNELIKPPDAAPPWETGRPFHILALSGGGFRGLYTATVLKHLEEQFGAPLASRFDLICGTSAGGLLALGLAADIPAADLQAMFQAQGSRIFGARRGWRRALGMWTMAKHSPDGLRSVLQERFGDLTIGDLRRRVLIPTVNYSKGSGHFFKTPHAPQFYLDYKHRLVDVGLATAAAPTYFPLHQIGEEGVYADGGLVGNSPGLFGLHEAQHVLNVPRKPGSARVLAIGTMTLGATKRGASGLDWGILHWRKALFDLVISSQEQAVDSMLKHLLGADYTRIDDPATPDQSRDIAALDMVTPQAIEVLTARGTQAARRALGDPAIKPFRDHVASAPVFYHGPNKSILENLHA